MPVVGERKKKTKQKNSDPRCLEMSETEDSLRTRHKESR